MNGVYIICRSQTEALIAYRLLEGAGIRGMMTRPPREEQSTSCAYAVRVRPEERQRAQQRLNSKGFAPYKIKIVSS